MSSPAVNLPPVEQRVIASPGETGRHGHRYYTINRSFHQGINTSTSLLSEPPEGPVEASRPARRLDDTEPDERERDSSLILASLRWLPVAFTIEFKILSTNDKLS